MECVVYMNNNQKALERFVEGFRLPRDVKVLGTKQVVGHVSSLKIEPEMGHVSAEVQAIPGYEYLFNPLDWNVELGE